jgi:hypothetical protein
VTAATPPPLLDEHTTTIAAGDDDTWQALLATVTAAFSGRPARTYARLIGSQDPGGFRVERSTQGSELVLAGRHLFSTYTLTFRLDPATPTSTNLTAESRAAFPGPHGRAYRLLVVSTGLHVRSVHRLLASVRRRAEATA